MRLILMTALAVTTLAVPAPSFAEGDRLQPNFTFRRVAVPGAGGGNRITVQIDPDAQSAIRAPDTPSDPLEEPVVAAATAPAAPAAPTARPTGVEWFWQAVSPSISDSGPGRLEPALRALANPPAGENAPNAPRVGALQPIAAEHGRSILAATIGTRVSPALALAVISVESGGRPAAESHAGAVGLMQLMPATAERFGVTDRTDPVQNIRGGVAYLDWLLGHFDGDPILAIAAYNSGEGAVRSNAGVPPYSETRNYVPKVLAAWTVARGLCQTPPVLISDGCVFTVNNL